MKFVPKAFLSFTIGIMLFGFHCNEKVKMNSRPVNSIPIGRFLINIPPPFKLGWGRQSCRHLGAFIQTFAAKSGQELLLMAEATIESCNKMQNKNMIQPQLLNAPTKGSYITISEDINGTPSYPALIHGYYAKNSRGFIFCNSSGSDQASINTIINKFERESSFLRIRGELEVPVGPGFCFDHAFFPDPAPHGQSEHACIHISFPEHPDVFIRFSTDVVSDGISKGTPLLERHGSLSRGLEAIVTGVRDLRARNRQVGPYAGQELITRVRERNLKIGYSFTWEYMGEGEDVLRPMMLLEMVTGHGRPPVQSSLSLKEATALWDGVLESIRLRVPTATFK